MLADTASLKDCYNYNKIRDNEGVNEMDIFRVIGVALIGGIVTLLLKQVKSEFSVLSVMASGIIILILVLNSLTDVIFAFNRIVDSAGIDSGLFSALLKIVGIGYVTEYSASLCDDMGVGTLGKKIQLAGKISIFLMALPIVTSLIDVISDILG